MHDHLFHFAFLIVKEMSPSGYCAFAYFRKIFIATSNLPSINDTVYFICQILNCMSSSLSTSATVDRVV